MELTRIRLTLAYDGTEYNGWQLQHEQPTVQGTLEKAISRICSCQVRVHGAGRTDAGTHALGQVAHFDPPDDKISLPWNKALNSLLPSSIRVIDLQTVSRDFHSRFSALSKTYNYTYWTEKLFVYPQRRRYVHKTGPLDIKAMTEAAASLVGRHDFRAFMNTGSSVNTCTRTVHKVSFSAGLYPQETVLRISADGFLKQMVRNIAGTLEVIGRNKYPVHYLDQLMKGKDRTTGPATAPAKGLCLESICYPD
ncbi:tRNA pseudouridine(38-40) synthase TruA [Desulfonatronovibrio magnus]|uniref:tRNA pseudouridine(38-40) synthase TruA n=1 Tax=Desulfonatronovibrio magnus TaxID=698827 RepID=UPI0006975F8B|nr:tRNA pseudouridine(38-40) synthase TruA [Desulfonatronovibrio magnus]RQD55525.1 MAG: tRNA pseudouridine(38-40) synthase TruA [Desulfonatronovibrio sp. MSAO_Bac4]